MMHKILRYISCILGIILCIFAIYTPAFALTLTDSENISVSAIVGSILPSIDTPNGNVSGTPSQKGIRFSGVAYPHATITVLQGQDKIISVNADDLGLFNALINNGDSQLYTLYAVDSMGRKSNLVNFPTVVYNGYLTDITGIRFAPTLVTDKVALKKGDFITIAGSAQPGKRIQIDFSGLEDMTFFAVSDMGGSFNLTVPLSLAEGEYIVKAKYVEDARISKALRIVIGLSTQPTAEVSNNIPGDCNVDRKINIVDYSVVAFWYGKSSPPSCVDTNRDGKINLVDFSILAYYWTE